MRILVLGGTIFLGRAIVQAAQERGHEVTLFNRGHHNPDLFPDCERLRGDRDGDLAALRGRQWDAAIDTNCNLPRLVRDAATLLADAVAQYTYISSVSAYADLSKNGITEDAPLATMPDATIEVVTGETFGPLKALCEAAAETAMPGRVLVVRPGLIVGPHDQSDRFTYWPSRVAEGGEVLAPASPGLPVQYIVDVRDLGAWIVRMVEAQATGVYNALGPASILSLGKMLNTCRAVGRSDAQFVWVSEEFLVAQGVGYWLDVPLWVPPTMAGIHTVSAAKAIAAGLTFRPLAETVADTLVWDHTRPANEPRRAGLTPEREREVLRAWHARA